MAGVMPCDATGPAREPVTHWTPEEPCSHRCGYVSSGTDLIDHETREHVTCTECGQSPLTDWDAVTHELDCPRLAEAAGEGEPS